ncbi:uncharacterized protein [Miscanthus floridulus]|uniref:uncharacterized protein n=1 Tax=Miscanthus floridulus TaxID=154761 RepID=UPI00345991B6
MTHFPVCVVHSKNVRDPYPPFSNSGRTEIHILLSPFPIHGVVAQHGLVAAGLRTQLRRRGGAGRGHARPAGGRHHHSAERRAGHGGGRHRAAAGRARGPCGRRVVAVPVAVDQADLVAPAAAVLAGAQGGGHVHHAPVLAGPHQALRPHPEPRGRAGASAAGAVVRHRVGPRRKAAAHALRRAQGTPRPPLHQQQQGQQRLDGDAGQLRPPRPIPRPPAADFTSQSRI